MTEAPQSPSTSPTTETSWDLPATVVLGVGSPLMGDDGLGVAVVEMLRARYPEGSGIDFVDGGTWGMQLLPQIESAERLLLLDVIRAGREPGTLVRLESDDFPRHLHHKVSPHQIDLGEVFALTQLRGTFPGEAVALGIEPELVELREELSPTVRAALGDLLAAACAQLAAWGHREGHGHTSEPEGASDIPHSRADWDAEVLAHA